MSLFTIGEAATHARETGEMAYAEADPSGFGEPLYDNLKKMVEHLTNPGDLEVELMGSRETLRRCLLQHSPHFAGASVYEGWTDEIGCLRFKFRRANRSDVSKVSG